MKFRTFYFVLFAILLFADGLFAQAENESLQNKIRHMVDTVGFSGRREQMDAILKYMFLNENENIKKILSDANIDSSAVWKTVISPHDDYTYVGYLYPALLQNVKAKTIILIGVCHKAKQFNLENKIIFDSYTQWKMPYGIIPVSGLRNEIIGQMNRDFYEIHDSMQAVEHSVEAIIPFLQYYNKDIEIISILVPYMPYNRMDEISSSLSLAIKNVTTRNNLSWGKDYAIVISTDAVHYGDEDWGGKNYAIFGTDTTGYNQAVSHEYEIINNCLAGTILPDKIKMFTGYTVKEDNFRDYKWTWCGRYSVPFGLLTTYYLQKLYGEDLTGVLIKYATSIDHPHIPVADIGMGVTAPANNHHWVGYAAIGYR
jgi:MEMO1 family protein